MSGTYASTDPKRLRDPRYSILERSMNDRIGVMIDLYVGLLDFCKTEPVDQKLFKVKVDDFDRWYKSLSHADQGEYAHQLQLHLTRDGAVC